jgi:ribosome-associated protein
VKPIKKVVAPKKTIHVSAPPKPVYSPLVEAVLKQLDDAKAEQIAVIDLVNRSTMADTMVIASGRSDRHVNAIADQVVETLEKNGLKNLRVEGKPQCDWVLVDSGDIIVHVFRPEVRSFYNLEKLWSPNAPKDQQA